jgi:hypothetical protein
MSNFFAELEVSSDEEERATETPITLKTSNVKSAKVRFAPGAHNSKNVNKESGKTGGKPPRREFDRRSGMLLFRDVRNKFYRI